MLTGTEEMRSCQEGECSDWWVTVDFPLTSQSLAASVFLQLGPLEGQHWNGEDSHSQRQVGRISLVSASSGGSRMQGSTDTEEEEEEDMQTCITYSQPPGWLWQSVWAPSPPGPEWQPSKDSSYSEGGLETTPRLLHLQSCKQRGAWVNQQPQREPSWRSPDPHTFMAVMHVNYKY